jgi:hypothetical protein
MNIVIDALMGWDSKLQHPTPNGGLFNFCKGFFASVESQGFGNLHTH